jgi:hypothetical protein
MERFSHDWSCLMDDQDLSPFALAAHPAKADPVLIGADVAHFARIEKSVKRQIAELETRLDVERRAPVESGQTAFERDLEIHRLTARLRLLRRFGGDLCLGHVVGEHGTI